MAKSFYLYIDCTNPEARKFTIHLIKNCKAFSVPEHLNKPYNYFIATIDKENRLIFRGWLKHPEQYSIIDSYGNEECNIHNFADRLVNLCVAHSYAFKSLNEQRDFRCVRDSSIIHLIDYINKNYIQPSQITLNIFFNNSYINKIHKENFTPLNNQLNKTSNNYETQLQRETHSQSTGECTNQSRIYCRRAKTQLCCYDVKPQEIHRNKKERNYRGLY